MAIKHRFTRERMRLSLSHIIRNPKNSNVVAPDVMTKLQKNIKKTGLYPPLIVRPLEAADCYMYIDGEHRGIVLSRLGETDAECEVWHVTEVEADILLATLNTLHGTEDKKLRASLIESLTRSMSPTDLATLLPENIKDIEAMAELGRADLDAMDALQTQDLPPEKASPKKFYLHADQLVIVEQALEHIKAREQLATGKNADGMALFYMSVEYLSGVDRLELEEKAMEKVAPIGSRARSNGHLA